MAKSGGLPTVHDVPKTTARSNAMKTFWVAAAVIVGIALAFLFLSKRNAPGATDGSSGDPSTVLTEENIYGSPTKNDGTTVAGGSAGGVPAPPKPGSGGGTKPPHHKSHKPGPVHAPAGHPIHHTRSHKSPVGTSGGSSSSSSGSSSASSSSSSSSSDGGNWFTNLWSNVVQTIQDGTLIP